MCPTESKEIILARGHENISAKHETTLEITKELYLSKKGDCIIAVGANKGIDDLGSEFKENLRKDHARIAILVEAGKVAERIDASGNSRLILAHPTDIVVRKTSYICNRTLAVQADKSACELSRELVEKLRYPEQKVKITLVIKA